MVIIPLIQYGWVLQGLLVKEFVGSRKYDWYLSSPRDLIATVLPVYSRTLDVALLGTVGKHEVVINTES